MRTVTAYWPAAGLAVIGRVITSAVPAAMSVVAVTKVNSSAAESHDVDENVVVSKPDNRVAVGPAIIAPPKSATLTMIDSPIKIFDESVKPTVKTEADDAVLTLIDEVTDEIEPVIWNVLVGEFKPAVTETDAVYVAGVDGLLATAKLIVGVLPAAKVAEAVVKLSTLEDDAQATEVTVVEPQPETRVTVGEAVMPVVKPASDTLTTSPTTNWPEVVNPTVMMLFVAPAAVLELVTVTDDRVGPNVKAVALRAAGSFEVLHVNENDPAARFVAMASVNGAAVAAVKAVVPTVMTRVSELDV